MKMYGSVSNRLEENRNYTGREIRVGDDITMYLWSDRHCYFVVDVISQKEIKVRKYYVCADHSKPGGMGHQDWVYFKTLKEENEYLEKFGFKHENVDYEEPEPQTWVFRYGKWVKKIAFDLNVIKNICEKQHFNYDKYLEHQFTDKQREKLLKGGSVAKYYDLSGKISFGVRDYYYDWEF